MAKIRRKLASQSGESIAEVLVSSLIVVLALLLFASLVIASRNLLKKSKESYTNYMTVQNEMERSLSGKETGESEAEVKDGTIRFLYSSNGIIPGSTDDVKDAVTFRYTDTTYSFTTKE